MHVGTMYIPQAVNIRAGVQQIHVYFVIMKELSV